MLELDCFADSIVGPDSAVLLPLFLLKIRRYEDMRHGLTCQACESVLTLDCL